MKNFLICLLLVISTLFTKYTSGQTYLMPNSGSDTISVCSGVLKDNGNSGNYTDNLNSTMVIKPGIPGNFVKITCTAMDLEACCDRLFIYRGIGAVPANMIGVFSSTTTFTIVSTDITGALTLVFESDEVTVASGFSINLTCVPCYRPDLFLSNYSMANDTVPNGQTLSSSIRVNNSNWTSQSSIINYFLSTDQTLDLSDHYLNSNTVNAINAGSFQTISTTLTFPDSTIPGNYYVLFNADATDTINECSEINNLESLPITVVQSTVDVKVNSITLSTNPDYSGFYNNGDLFTGSVIVKNIGNTKYTGNGLVSIYFSKDSLLSSEDIFLATNNTTLNPGTTNSVAFTYGPAINMEPGNYYIIAKTDVNNLFNEPSEINNIDFLEFEVQQSYHDLEAVSITNIPPAFKFNTAYNLQLGIRNNGRYYTSFWYPYTYQIILSTDSIYDNNDVILSTTETNSTVDINAITTISKSINFTGITFPAGPAYLMLVVETSGLLTETNESNNTKFYPILFPEVNFDIAPTSITVNNQVPLGVSFTISSSVTNLGTHFFNGSNVNYYLSTDNVLDPADYFLGNQSSNSNVSPDAIVNLSSVNVTIPPMFSTGNYFILTYADPMDVLNEINETNNVFATPVTVSNFLPDLQLSSITSSSIIYANGENSINLSIVNSGHTPASNFNITLYISSDTIVDGSDLQIYNQNFGGTIQAGNTYNFSYNDYPNNTNYPIGSGYIIAKLNGTNSMNEYSLLNNVSYFPVTVANGTYNIVAVSQGNISTVQQGNNISLYFRINNAGTAALNNVGFAYYWSTDAVYDVSDILIWASSTSPLMPSDFSNTSIISYPVPTATTPGTYYIIYYADNNNVFSETNESNNIIVDDFTVTAVPVPGIDLDIVTSGTTISHTTIGDGTLFGGAINMDNIGSIAANSSNCAVYLSTNNSYDSGDIQLTTITSGTVNPSPNVAVNYNYTLPVGTLPGNYYMIYFADYDSLVTESFETNNTLAKQVTIVTSDNDLKMIPNTFPNDTILSSISYTYSYWVKNYSNNGYYGGSVHYLLSTDTVPDAGDYMIGTTNLSLIDIGESPAKTANLTIPSATADGNYYFIYYVDYVGIYPETNEFNNYKAIPFYLKTPYPDLEVLNYSLITPEKVASGATSSSTFEGKIRNSGEISSTSSNMRYYISSDTIPDVSDYVIGTSPGTSLAVSTNYTSRNLSDLVSSSVIPGNYHLIQKVDPDDLIIELDENNNVQHYPITIYPLYKDLITTYITKNFDSIPVGRTLNLMSGVKNDGTIVPGSTHYFNYYLSSDTLYDGSDIQLYSGTISINLAPGNTSTVNQNVTVPNVAPGDYYILGYSDAFSSLTEPDELNNILYSPIKIAPQTFDVFHDLIGIVSDTLIPSENNQVMGELINTGNNKLSSVGIHFYLSTDTTYSASDVLLYSTNVSNLNYESSDNYYHSFSTPTNVSSGNYYVLFIADFANAFSETNELNNIKYLPVFVENYESDLSILPNGASTQLGFIEGVTSYQNYFTMRNTGNKPANNFNIRIQLSPDSSLVTLPNYDMELSPNLSLASFTDTWDNLVLTIPSVPAGDYFMFYEIDYLNEIIESDENNNTSLIPVKIINDSLDILPYSLSAPVSAVEGTSFTISYSIKNTSAFAILSERNFYLSTDSIFDANDNLIGGASINTGGGISSSTVSATLPSGLLTGFYYIIFVTDQPGNILETDESNNILIRPIYIENSVTLNFTQTGYQLLQMCGGTIYDYGDATNPYFNAANSMITVAPQTIGYNVKLDFLYLVTESCCDKLRIFDGPDTLSPLIGSYTTNPGTVFSTHSTGRLTLVMYSDSANVASGFAANVSCVIPGTDLLIDNEQLSANTINNGSNVNLDFDIQNYGSVISNTTNVKIALSTDAIFDISDLVLADLPIAPIGMMGTIAFNEILTPNVPSIGTYYILIYADQNLLVSETNENNNIKVLPITILDSSITTDITYGVTNISTHTIQAGFAFQLYPEIVNVLDPIGQQSFKVFRSADTILSANDLMIDSVRLNSMTAASQQNLTRSLSLPLNSTNGTQYLLLVSDADHEYVEMNESNNIEIINIFVFGSVSSVSESPIESLFHMYPNPANDLIQLNYLGLDNLDNQIIQIFDLSGKLVMHKHINSIAISEIITLDISSLSDGIYQLKIGNFTGEIKLVIVR